MIEIKSAAKGRDCPTPGALNEGLMWRLRVPTGAVLVVHAVPVALKIKAANSYAGRLGWLSKRRITDNYQFY